MRWANMEGHYELNSLPGCSQVVVSNHAYVKPDFRGKGLGQAQHKARLANAKYFGYNYIICTVKSDNEVEKHILKKNHWNHLDTFDNTETGNAVEIWGRPV